MHRSCLALCLLLSLCAVPAAAGVLYVPVPPLPEGHSVDLQAVNRDDAAKRRFTARLLPLGKDGAAAHQSASGTTVQVPRAGANGLSLRRSDGPGLLVIESAPQLSFDARLTTEGSSGPGLALPVITSDNGIAAGETVELPRLDRTAAGVATGLGIVNLAPVAAGCKVGLEGAGGTALREPVQVALPPLSHSYFADALAAFGVGTVADAFFEVSCDQPFSTYALLRDESGPLGIVVPAGRGSSKLSLPGKEPEVPPGAVVFRQLGAFHTARLDKPTEVFNFPVPAEKSFRELRVSFDYQHAGWSHEPEGNHSLFWLHRGIWLQSYWRDNIYAFVNAFGGRRREVKLLTNVDAGQARQVWKGTVELQAGHTYRVEYLYDTVAQAVSVKLTDKGSGEQVVEIVGDTYGRPIVADASGTFFIYFGHQDDTGIAPERPSYGSTWSALEVLFLP